MLYLLAIPNDILSKLFSFWFEKIEIGNLDSAYCNKSQRNNFLSFLQSPEYFVHYNFCMTEIDIINSSVGPTYVNYNYWLGLRAIRIEQLVIYRDDIDCSSFYPDGVQKLFLFDVKKMPETKVVNCVNLFHKLKLFSSNSLNVSDVFFYRVNHKILSNLVTLILDQKTLMSFYCIHILSNVCTKLTRLTLGFHDEVEIAVDTFNDWSVLFIANRFEFVEFNLGFNSILLCGHILNCISRFQMTSIINCEISHSNFDGMLHDVSVLVQEFTSIISGISYREQRLDISVIGVHSDNVKSCIHFDINSTRSQITLESISFYVDHHHLLPRFLKSCKIDHYNLYDIELRSDACKLFILQCRANSKLILDLCDFDIVDLDYLLTTSNLTKLSITNSDDDLMYRLVSVTLGKRRNYLTHLWLCGSGYSLITTQNVLDLIENCKCLKKLKVQQNSTEHVDWDYLIGLYVETKIKVLIKLC
jgi:hypothetical protein